MNLRRNYGSIRNFSLLTNFCLKVKFLIIICIFADSSMHYYLQDVYARKGVADDKNKDDEETGKERTERLRSESRAEREKVLERGVKKNASEQLSDGIRGAENGSPHMEVEFSISRKKSSSNLSTARDEPVDGKEEISSLKKQSCWRESERKILEDKGDWKTTQNVPGAGRNTCLEFGGQRSVLCSSEGLKTYFIILFYFIPFVVWFLDLKISLIRNSGDMNCSLFVNVAGLD